MLGDNIKVKRIECGLSQSELGKKLGVSSKTVSSWEVNRTEPNVGMLERLSQVFFCNKTDLLDGTKSAKSEAYELFNQLDNDDMNTICMMMKSMLSTDKYKKDTRSLMA